MADTPARQTEAPQTESVGVRAIRSSFWLFFIRFSARLIGLGQVFVLARVLAPGEFGLIGLALLLLAMLKTFSEAGVDLALIQRSGDISGHMNTAWSIQVLRAALLAAILFFLAPWYVDFFDVAEALSFIRAFSFTVLLMGFTNIGIVRYKKEVRYDKLVLFEMVPQLANVVTTVTLALVFRDVWAIFFGRLVLAICHVTLSYVIHPFRPRFRIVNRYVRDLFSFGKWIYLTNILVFLLNQGDDIAVGRVISVSALGFYQVAFRMARLPVTELNNTLAKVLFPAFAELQHDRERLRRAYYRALQVILLATAPFSLGIFVLAPWIIPVLLGARWEPATGLAQTFALLGLLVSVGSTTASVFRSIGQPKVPAQAQIVRAIVMFSLLFPLMDSRGALGAAVAVVVSEMVISPYLVWRVRSELGGTWRELGRVCGAQVVSAGAMAGATFVLAERLDPSTALGLVALGALAATCYLVVLGTLDRLLRLGLLQSVIGVLAKVRRRRNGVQKTQGATVPA